MSKKRVRLVLICEDLQQMYFVRRYLMLRYGYKRHELDERIAPKGSGSGEQFVRERYVKEVQAYRRQLGYRPVGSAIIAMVDADMNTVVERQRQFDQALLDEGQATRQKHEQIGVFVPRRNIETWIRYLRGETVVENDLVSYAKQTGSERSCLPQVKHLVALCQTNALSADAPDSLHRACDEIGHLQLSRKPK